ncbi:protein liaG [Paenibacillus sp. PK3_47]|nr:protein liaG [Paenibacillus sp. PK3_47]
MAAVLIFGGLWLGVREVLKGWLTYRRNERPLRRVGRYTAAVLLTGVGILLLLDSLYGTDRMFLLLDWWPIVPVLWGLEYLLIYLFSRRMSSPARGYRARMDLRGIVTSLVLAASVFIVAEQEHYLHLWNRVSLNLTAAAVDYGEAEGSRFQKAPLVVPVELSTAKITVDGINGDILLHRAPVEDVVITATVWVDQLEGPVAEAISEQSFVEVTEGTTIKITPQTKAYGDSGKRQPRMDLDISLPEDRRFNFEVRTMNGGITLQNVEAIADISLETGNGELILHRVLGDVKGKTLNGAVRARTVQGNIELSTGGGDMNAWDVTGAVKLSTTVGNISAVGSSDELDLASKNGNLEIDGARAKLHAESLNGKIDIRSEFFGGDWDVYSAVGDINLYVPSAGSFTVEGSSGYGNITTDLPGLTIDKKTISGEIGTGEFKLRVEGNSNLNVREY